MTGYNVQNTAKTFNVIVRWADKATPSTVSVTVPAKTRWERNLADIRGSVGNGVFNAAVESSEPFFVAIWMDSPYSKGQGYGYWATATCVAP